MVEERWHRVGGRPVRSLSAGARTGHPDLVLVPGLGALGYLRPLVLGSAAWARVHLLDVPGFGHRSTAHCPSALPDVAATVAGWLREVADAPVLLAGHSTGAQAALLAGLETPERVAGLVLAGATFPPAARRPLGLAARVLRTLPHERLAELPAVLPDYLRAGRRMWRLLASALADRPEDRIGRWDGPLLVVRGRQDAVCPADWAQELADRAPRGRCLTLPGAHNFPFTDPDPASAALRAALGDSGA